MEPDPSAPRAVILVAEDDPDIRGVLEMLLPGEGYGVVTTADGVEALRLATRRRPDLILVDLLMPRLGGIGFCRAYRDRGGTAPIVLLTAMTGPAVQAAVEACDASAYVAKPFDIDVLLATIARHLAP
jgi:CheY-like chemotaxis protein